MRAPPRDQKAKSKSPPKERKTAKHRELTLSQNAPNPNSMFSSGKGDPFVRTKGALLSSHAQQIKKAVGYPLNAPGSKLNRNGKGGGIGGLLRGEGDPEPSDFLAGETKEAMGLAFKKAPRINELLRNALNKKMARGKGNEDDTHDLSFASPRLGDDLDPEKQERRAILKAKKKKEE